MRILVLLLLVVSSHLHAQMLVKYIGNNAGVNEGYYLEIIDTAMKKTEAEFGAYRIEFSREPLTSDRKHDLLVAGERVNIDRIVGFHSNTGPRGALLQVNVPLLRGFMGCRIPLIRGDSQTKFDAVHSLADLKKMPMGLGKGWEGYIYKGNGFSVTEPITFDLLLKMLAGSRYDFVPLSAIEIEDTYSVDNQPLTNLAVEKNILIYTPLPNYFYVSPAAPELARRLRVGMKKMEADGSMSKIFDQHFSERLKKLHLRSRRVIEIPNPEDDGSLGKLDYKEIQRY